ncbi:hypothetical protein GGR88_000001 [Sphingomonas jejuensis]|uniref:Tetratricopeptide repeat protein n=1 Tax=Sphingomonas jejuensis TaxID=904715 RepID=A0ABX0XI24_9SPHN|nr:hypothetical protein [Sphingomonas jejuensis]NJC32527.1 hypothetical protein [Sphingomonas jejuensis]
MTTDPDDLKVLEEASAAVSSRSPDLARLDAVLIKLPRPTPLRGMIQSVRAGALHAQNRSAQAVAAINEGLRLLPNHPVPQLIASGIFTFTGAPQRGADLWMQASVTSPELARGTDPYMLDALIGRLYENGDRTRGDRLSARMAEIGFSTALASARSHAALARTREAVQNQQLEEALRGIALISNPADLEVLFVDRRYEDLWPRIAEWGGTDFDPVSRRYLEELRGDWVAAGDLNTATEYARRLSLLRADAAVVELFLPLFDEVRVGAPQDGMEFLAPVVARSMIVVGRHEDAYRLLEKVAAAYPEDAGGNSLNIDAAFVSLAMEQANWPEVISSADRFLRAAEALGPSINRSPLIAVRSALACAYSRTAQMEDARLPAAEVLLAANVMPGSALNLHLCRGDTAAAQALIVARLEDVVTRDWALRFVQAPGPRRGTPLELLTGPTADQVRAAPEVIAAANKHGRILPAALARSLPDGFDPLEIRPAPQPLDPNAI